MIKNKLLFLSFGLLAKAFPVIKVPTLLEMCKDKFIQYGVDEESKSDFNDFINQKDLGTKIFNYTGKTLEKPEFSSMHLKRFNFTKARLIKANFKDSILKDTIFYGTIFEDIDFRNTDLKGVNFTNCKFIRCNLEKVDLSETSLDGCKFKEVKFHGAHFSDDVEFDENMPDIEWIKLYANFIQKIKTGKAKALNKLFEVYSLKLTGKNLWGLNLSGINLRKAVLHNANLKKVRLSDTLTLPNYKNYHQLILLYSKFINKENSKDAGTLNGVLGSLQLKLHNKDLSNLNLKGINLSHAVLSDANLTNTNLSYANLTRVHLEGTNLISTNLAGAKINASDVWKDYYNLTKLTEDDRLVSLELLEERGFSIEPFDEKKYKAYSINLIKSYAKDPYSRKDYNLKIQRFKVDLRGADLRGLDLSEINLSGCNLSGSNLIGTNVREANFIGANLTGAKIKTSDWSRSLWNNVKLTEEDAAISPDLLKERGVIIELLNADEHKTYSIELINEYSNKPNSRTALNALFEKFKLELSGEDLRGLNLSGINLSRSNLAGADLSGSDLSGSNLIEMNLTGANLVETNLTGAKIKITDIWRVAWQNVKLTEENILISINLLKERGVIIELLNADEYKTYSIELINQYFNNPDHRNFLNLFIESTKLDLSGKDLRGLNLSGINLSRCNLAGADLSGSDLSGSNLIGTNVKEANFIGANLTGAKIKTSDWNRSLWNNVKLTEEDAAISPDLLKERGVIIELLNADEHKTYSIELINQYSNKLDNRTALNSKFQSCRLDLRGADLRGLNLSGINLSRSNLSGADLSGSDLSGSNLIGTNVREANFIGANLTGSKIKVTDLWKGYWKSIKLTEEDSPISINLIKERGVIIESLNVEEHKAYSIELIKFYSNKLDNRTALNSKFQSCRLDLRGADLRGLNLNGINLTKANLEGAKLSFADLFENRWLNVKLSDDFVITTLDGLVEVLESRGIIVEREEVGGQEPAVDSNKMDILIKEVKSEEDESNEPPLKKFKSEEQ